MRLSVKDRRTAITSTAFLPQLLEGRLMFNSLPHSAATPLLTRGEQSSITVAAALLPTTLTVSTQFPHGPKGSLVPVSAVLISNSQRVAGRTVQFFSGSTLLKTAVTSSAGIANASIRVPNSGYNQITVKFSGDAHYGSSSVSFTLVGDETLQLTFLRVEVPIAVPIGQELVVHYFYSVTDLSGHPVREVHVGATNIVAGHTGDISSVSDQNGTVELGAAYPPSDYGQRFVLIASLATPGYTLQGGLLTTGGSLKYPYG